MSSGHGGAFAAKPERVTILSLLWLTGVASGVLARGGRMFWVGRAMMLIALGLPAIFVQRPALPYFGFVVATLALLLTCGRVTRELRGMLERARYDADHDSLTGALSRAAFRSGLDQLASAAVGSELAVLLVDLDGFGSINKTNGHGAGDAAMSSRSPFATPTPDAGRWPGRRERAARR